MAQRLCKTNLAIFWSEPYTSHMIQLFFPEYLPTRNKRICPCEDLYRNVIAALFLIAQHWEQSRCSSTDERINKQWYSHTMEYYSSIRMNGRFISLFCSFCFYLRSSQLTYSVTWVEWMIVTRKYTDESKMIMLSERSQTKNTSCKGKIWRQKSEQWYPEQELGVGKGLIERVKRKLSGVTERFYVCLW